MIVSTEYRNVTHVNYRSFRFENPSRVVANNGLQARYVWDGSAAGIFNLDTFSQDIPDLSAIKIVKYRIKCNCHAYNHYSYSILKFRIVTDFKKYWTNADGTTDDIYKNQYTNISTNDHVIFTGGVDQDSRIVEVDDETEIKWMNDHKSIIRDGNQFGIRIVGTAFVIKNLMMQIDYEPLGSNLYNGSKQASAIYVGSNKGSMYIGTTKVL